MTAEQAEALLQHTTATIAVRQRFAFDTGTLLRLDNCAIINIFDDGRYFIQGENTEALIALFSQTEAPWDPNTWNGEVPHGARPIFLPPPGPANRRSS